MRAPLDSAERRRRLVVRHRLAAAERCADPVRIADGVLALHATDPTSVYLQIAARTGGRPDGAAERPNAGGAARPGATVADVEDALYERRSLLRLMGMRRTLFVAPVETAGVVQQAAMDRVAADQHRRLVKEIGDHAAVRGDVGRWVDEAAADTLRALADLGGEASTEQLAAAVPRLRTELVLSPGKKWQATITVASRLIVLLGCQGRIIRGRPGGGWASRRYRWALPEVWLGHPFPGASVPPCPTAPAPYARAELVRRWLCVFGPAPESDLRWWTGWPLGRLRAALADVVGLVEVDGDTGRWLGLAEDLGPTPAVPPAAALLPALDPTVMGWSERSWYLGDHAPRLFDRFGNAGPTVWWDGRVVGGWAQAPDGELRVRLFADPGRDAGDAITAEAARLTAWIGPRRFTPTFRTPTELELLA